jgi:hypothetical protein
MTSQTLGIGNIVLVMDDVCTTEWAKDQRHGRCTLRKDAPTHFQKRFFCISHGTAALTALY